MTSHGLVRVEWLEVAGDRCWFSSGTGDAKREAVASIEFSLGRDRPSLRATSAGSSPSVEPASAPPP